MPRKIHSKKALCLDGLHFPPGQLFSNQVLSERMYGLLLGPKHSETEGTNQVAQMRQRASGILSQIFNLCLARIATFAALDDWTLGWQIVVGDMAEKHGCIMEAGEVEELVTVFADARTRFLDGPWGDRAPNMLAGLIDQWLDAGAQHNAGVPSSQPPAASSSLPARPAPLENLLSGFSLLNHGTPSAAPASPATADTDWPPSHLPPTDRHLLDHFKIREHLAGVCWDAKGAMPNLPGDHSDPVALRLFLGWLAAAHTPPPHVTDTALFALFAAPVAFATNKERQAWFRPSGCQSKLFGHMDGFLAYAAEGFTAGKTMALGLLTPVFATPAEARGMAEAAGDGGEDAARETFNNHGRLRRFGAALMLRLVERKGTRGVQVVFFCPWDEHPWIKEQWRPQDWQVRLWKSAVLDTVAGWATKHGVVIHEGYSGGSIRVRKDRDHDSVGMCAGWLLRVVTATEKTIPGDGEDEECEWENTCYFKKLENWGKVDKDIEEDEKMDVDADM